MVVLLENEAGRRGFEVEEEFDLVKLGFAFGIHDLHVGASNNKGNKVTKEAEDHTQNRDGTAQTLSVRPALASFRTKSGRYASADWAPDNSTSQFDSQVDEHRSDGNSVTAHDFVNVSGLTEEAPKEKTPESSAMQTAQELTDPIVLVPDSTSVNSTPSLASGILTSTETTSITPLLTPHKPRTFTAQLVTVRRPGRKGQRLGVRIKRTKPDLADRDVFNIEIQDEAVSTPEPPPDSRFLREVLDVHGKIALEQLRKAAKLHNTTGDLLPSLLRDILPTLADRRQALQVANEIRTNFDLPTLPMKVDRVVLHKALAQMRERLYLELAGALILPTVPTNVPPAMTDEEDRMSMSLTPSSFETLGRTLPKAFHSDRGTIKAVFESKEGMYGEEGDVVWTGGVGSMKRRLKEGELGMGYRGYDAQGLVHIFVDHSNILHGLLHHLYSSPLPLPPRHQRILSLPCLSLLLQRGRATQSSHLVASSPLHQDLDPIVRLGWEVSILKRVEIYESEVTDSSAAKLTPKAVPRSVAAGAGGGTRRYKEQGVDEVLTLKMLQTINRVEVGKGSTIVLATGDARGGQFNKEGFLGAVREAVNRGWIVELWSFGSGLSRAWKETAKREGWDGRFRIYLMDDYAGELVEVNEEAE